MIDQLLLDAMDEVTEVPGRAEATSPRHAEAIRVLRAAGWLDADRALPRSDRGCVVGLDLGGTKLRGAIADASGRILAELAEPTAKDSLASTRTQLVAMVGRLAAAAQVPLGEIAHVAIGVPGVVDSEGRVALSPNVAFDAREPLATTLGEHLAVPVSVENDGNLAAFGELTASPREAGRSLAFLALGTGVGMGLIIDGAMLRGRTGAAGEIAFLPFGPTPYETAHTTPGGAFEAIVGSAGIRADFTRRSGTALSVRQIFDRADAGDPDALATVEAFVSAVALGLGAVVALLDPGQIILGGGIGARPGLAARIGEKLAGLVPAPCSVVTSRLGERAGVVGAVAHARQQAKRALLSRFATPHSETRS